MLSTNKDHNNGPLERSLIGERDKLQREIGQLRDKIRHYEKKRMEKEARLGHVQALLSAEPPELDRPPPHAPVRSFAASTPTPKLLDMAEQVLRDRDGEPMHYRELADELLRRGAVIRGKDPAAALVSRMTQDDNRRVEQERRFIRPTSKGFYALREDYPQARNVGARRRRDAGKATEGSH